MKTLSKALGVNRASLSRIPLTRNFIRLLGRCGLIPFSIVAGAPVSGSFAARVGGVRFLYELGPRDTIGEILYWTNLRGWETKSVETFLHYARTARGILDVGANGGIYSLLACAANPRARVTAWEPVPYLNQRLSRNIRLNQFHDRCQTRTSAVCDFDGETELFVPEDETTAASLTNGFGGRQGSMIPVITERIDSFVLGTPVDLIKIDVEGAEPRVLAGAMDTLRDHRPTIIFECFIEDCAEQITGMLAPLGYRLFAIFPNRLEPVSRVSRMNHLGVANFLALANP